MFADDTNLTYASKDPDELFSFLTRDFIVNLKQQLDSNRLSLNVVKTKCLFFWTRHKISLLPSNSDICLDGHSIEMVDSYKCLGIQVHETITSCTGQKWSRFFYSSRDFFIQVTAVITDTRPSTTFLHIRE